MCLGSPTTNRATLREREEGEEEERAFHFGFLSCGGGFSQ